MSQIIINEKNFDRFAARMSQILQKHTNGDVSLGRLQSQELFSKILGVENVHELRTHLKKERVVNDYTFKLSATQVNDFFEKKLNPEQETKFIEQLNSRMGYVCSRIADISGYEFSEWYYPDKKPAHSPSILNCLVFNYQPQEDMFKTDMKDMMHFNFEYTNKKVITYDKYIGSFPTQELKNESVAEKLRINIK
jgi:hypothetical protein